MDMCSTREITVSRKEREIRVGVTDDVRVHALEAPGKVAANARQIVPHDAYTPTRSSLIRSVQSAQGAIRYATPLDDCPTRTGRSSQAIGLKQDELDRCGIFHFLRTARWLRVTPTAGTPCPSSPPWPMAYITELGVADESVETNVDEELAWTYIERSNIKAGHVVCLQRGHGAQWLKRLNSKQIPSVLRACRNIAIIQASEAQSMVKPLHHHLYDYNATVTADERIIPSTLSEKCKIRMNAYHHPKARGHVWSGTRTKLSLTFDCLCRRTVCGHVFGPDPRGDPDQAWEKEVHGAMAKVVSWRRERTGKRNAIIGTEAGDVVGIDVRLWHGLQRSQALTEGSKARAWCFMNNCGCSIDQELRHHALTLDLTQHNGL
nr:hypothetical protein CFP56_11301 [Quercus suber]